MPEDTRRELERAAKARQGLGKFVGVPDSWEGWAVRILTVAVVLTLATQAFLGRMIADQNDFLRESRSQRTEFQLEETARQCAILSNQGETVTELKAMKC